MRLSISLSSIILIFEGVRRSSSRDSQNTLFSGLDEPIGMLILTGEELTGDKMASILFLGISLVALGGEVCFSGVKG